MNIDGTQSPLLHLLGTIRGGVELVTPMSLGILDMIGIAGTLIFALPVGIFGVEQLATGQFGLGSALIGIAALMIILPQRLITPKQIPVAMSKRLIGIVGTSTEEQSADGTDTTDEPDSAVSKNH